MENAKRSMDSLVLNTPEQPLPRLSETLVNQVSSWIADQIIQGKLQPGEELGIRPLAARLGVSPTPVREALRSLESEGLVELPPRRSPHVATLTKRDVLDIYSCRTYLNGLAAKLASEQMTPDVLTRLESLVNEMSESAQHEDVQRYFTLTVQFNEIVVESTRNQVLQSLLHSLGRRTLRLRYLSITVPGRIQAGVEFHRELLHAFQTGNSAQAEYLMMRQIVNAQEVLLRHFLDSETI